MSEHPPTLPLPLNHLGEDIEPGRLVRPLLVLARWAEDMAARRRERRIAAGTSIWEPIHLGIGEDGLDGLTPAAPRRRAPAGRPPPRRPSRPRR